MTTPALAPTPRLIALTALAMVAFAANSVLCRLALARGSVDPASFTLIRIAAGAAMLWLLLAASGRAGDFRRSCPGQWRAAVALFVYAAAFSFGYVSLSAGAGALLLFGAVQATMLTYGLWRGERLAPAQALGLACALAGMAALLAPGASAPPRGGALLMLVSGAAWGGYSLLGRGARDPLAATAGNFLRASPFALGLLAIALVGFGVHCDAAGLFYALLSGAVASGLGYAIWYAVLPGLTATQAASVQLSAPVIAALAGAATLDEAIGWRLSLSSIAVLGGIALVIAGRRRAS